MSEKSYLDRLDEVLESIAQRGQDHADAAMREEFARQLKDLADLESEVPAPERFFMVCETVAEAFRGQLGSDEQVRSHPLAAPLVRYVVQALLTYYQGTDHSDTPTEKASLLAAAMGLRGRSRGGPRKGYISPREQSRLAFTFSVEVGRLLGQENERDETERYNAAFASTFRKLYDQHYESDTLDGRSPQQSKLNRRRLFDMLCRHGVANPLSDDEVSQLFSS